MDFFQANELENAMRLISPENQNKARTHHQNGYAVYVREDGSIFASDSQPKSIAAKRKIGVVAVVKPVNGFCG